MSDKKEESKESNKKKDDIFKDLTRTIKLITFTTSMLVWCWTIGKVLGSIISALIASAWAGTLIMFIWTGDYLYLKIFCTVPVVGLIGYFQVGWMDELLKYKNNKLNKKLKKSHNIFGNNPNLNEGYFGKEAKSIKCLILDEKDPFYNKELDLYSMYGRFNPNKSLSFYKPSEVKIINEENK